MVCPGPTGRGWMGRPYLRWSASLSQQQRPLAVPSVAPRDQTLRMAAQFGQPVHNLLRYQATFGSAALSDAFRRFDLGECLRTVTRDVASCGTQARASVRGRAKVPA